MEVRGVCRSAVYTVQLPSVLSELNLSVVTRVVFTPSNRS